MLGKIIRCCDDSLNLSSMRRKEFRRLPRAHGIEGSMSRKGDCWDNAVVESFFGSPETGARAVAELPVPLRGAAGHPDYISMFYNSRRLHSYLGYMSPNDYERQLTERKKAA